LKSSRAPSWQYLTNGLTGSEEPVLKMKKCQQMSRQPSTGDNQNN
jgi:hypothetical protein